MPSTVSRSVHVRTLSATFVVALLGALFATGVAQADDAAVPAAWPETWTEYATDETPVTDENGDESPDEVDIASGDCDDAPCTGAGSVWYAATADTVFFRLRLAGDPYTPAKEKKAGELKQFTYFVQLGNETDGVLAVVGADGKADPDTVYVTNHDGTETEDVHSGPFDTQPAGLRTVPVDDHFYLDFQVPLATLTDVSGVTATTPVSLFFATGTDQHLDKIGKDLMSGTEVTFDDDDGITLGNAAPVAADDALVLDEDSSGLANVVANDTDADAGDVLSLPSITTGPTNGTATVGPTGITYVPEADWNGADSLVYEVCDLDGACDTATLTITVDPVNDAPVVTGPAVDLPVASAGVRNTAVTVTDIDDTEFVLTIPTTPGKGTAVVDSLGAVVYTAAPGASGRDSFSVQACDSGGLCDIAVLSVVIAAVVPDGAGPTGPTGPTGPGSPTTPGTPTPVIPATPAAPAGPITEALDAGARRPTGSLASTGAETVPVAATGALLLLAGLALVSTAKRWSRQAS